MTDVKVEKNPNVGLGDKKKADWIKVQEGVEPIEMLAPGTDHHRKVLNYLTGRLRRSERAMTNFERRWQAAEIRTQSYIKRSDFEKVITSLNEKGEPPRPLNITVPYIFSTLNSIVTYLMHTFAARKPVFAVETNKEESVQSARMMENLLQYNTEHEKLAQKFRQFFWDGELYGVGIMRTEWRSENSLRTVFRPKPNVFAGIDLGKLGLGGEPEMEQVQEEYMSFQGTSITNIDPRNFFPDPSVPMCEVSKEGEYVFWKLMIGKHKLLVEQSAGRVKHIDYVADMKEGIGPARESARGLIADSPERVGSTSMLKDKNQIGVHFCSIDIIPKELGLGSGEKVVKWIFAIANRSQIILAEPLTANHQRHPVVVSEPYTLGYDLGQPSVADYLGPLQDLISWYANSHVHNVRTSLNNVFLYNPQMINENDVKNPAPGKGIRILPTALGLDPKTFFKQLEVRDVTANHMNDLSAFTRIADVLSGVNDNLRGVEESNSSRRTASEVRISAQSAASRLADHARLISSQAITDLAMIMCVNYQQYLSEEFYIRVTGQKGARTPMAINHDSISGDFTFPTHDGTLPTDRVALVEVWKEIFSVIAPDPQLRQQYDLTAILEWMASESGASNLGDFKVQASAGEPAPGQVPMSEVAEQLG